MARDRKFWLTALAVAGVFVFALFVRTYWNVEAATPGSGTPEGTFLLSESDAYFHRHSVERLQSSGWKHPIEEPLVNYPVGGINPNPPLMTWWIGVWGVLASPFLQGDAANHATACPADAQPSQATCVSTWWQDLFTPALFGAFTVLLVVLLGREVWGWRAGLLAGFLLATSTSHIERSVFGFADHDSFVLFFIVLSFLFFVKALHAARENRWVAHWSDLSTVREGWGSYFRANQLSLAYAAMAGLALAGVGLSWKGYAYAAGILLAYGVVQVLVNHWRQRDNTHIFAVVGLALLLGFLLTVPYYGNAALGAVFDTMMPVLFIFLAWVVLGVVFTAARDLPFVLVLPAAALAGALALLVAFFVAPSVAQSLLAPLVYFKQTKLYTTIAEAHPADFNTVVFGTGFAGFFIAIVALPWLLWENRKAWRPAPTFMALWGLVAIFMTHSAVRFMFNATPAFALLGGWGTSLIVGRLKFETIGKNLVGFGGFSRQALKRSINAWHVVGALLLALLLVFPNVILAVDAGMPAQYEDKLIRDELAKQGKPYTDANRAETFIGSRFGAFGQGFITDYWRELFEWLALQDTGQPPAQRPAFLSWWDYGHWALSLGDHPAVADNFQNGFQFAGNFIASQNESHAVQLLIARAIDLAKQGRGPGPQDFIAIFQEVGLSAGEAQEAYDALASYGYSPHLPLPKATEALAKVEAKTGARIRYFAVDVRLFPYDNPQTQGIDFGSIFYAPIILSDHNPDDFVEAIIRANVPGERKSEFNTTEWADIQKDVRKAALINYNTVFQLYKYKEPFFNSMFYRTYIGTPLGLGAIPITECVGHNAQLPAEGDVLPGIALPGYCMEHFRLVYFSNQVRMLKYYPGAVVEGRVLVDGKPMANARVAAFDDAGDLLHGELAGLLTEEFKQRFRSQFGRDVSPRDFDVPHATTTTDDQGNYSILVPFSTTREVTVRAYVDQAEVGNKSFQVSVEQAEGGFRFDPALGLMEAESGGVSGRVYFDRDRDGGFGPGDQALPGARVSVDGNPDTETTTDAGGAYNITGVSPGRHSVLADLEDFEMARRVEEGGVLVKPGETTAQDVAMALGKAQAEAHVWRDGDADGQRADAEGVTGVSLKALPDYRAADNTAIAETSFSRENGTVGLEMTPGKYLVRGEWVNTSDGSGWAFGALLEVARGLDTLAIPDDATQLFPATAATLNLTLETQPGNITGAAGAQVLFIPTEGGKPAGERAPANGTLTLRLVPGTYEVHAKAMAEGAEYVLPQPLTLVVGTEPVAAEGRLQRQG